MQKILTTMFFLLLGRFLIAQPSQSFQILPQPQSVEYIKSGGITYNELKYIVSENSEMPVLPELLNVLPRAKKIAFKGITLEITTQGTPENPQGYLLEVSAKGALIKAQTQTGLFYGCQTLQQLMEDSRDFEMKIPAMVITDYPAISYRAIHLDTKHHLDRMEYYYSMMDKLAHYKVNAVIWEIEDKLRFTRRPEIGAPQAISKQEMHALCRYAKERHIDISPLVQGLGHAAFILKHHPELRENPKSDWEFCPAEPKTYELQFDLYTDALEAMPYGKYLHVGGDEITAIGIDDRCKATGKNTFELQMSWLKKVCGYAVQHNRTPIFWDDMPLKYGEVWDLIEGDIPEDELNKKWSTSKLDEAINLFPKECVYMRWNYGDVTLPAHQKIVRWYQQKGLKVMGATAASAGDSPFLPRAEKPGYIKGFSQLIAENNLMGILATAWDDGSPHLETVWRGYIAQGEFGWNPFERNVEAFKRAHAQREFGFTPDEQAMRFLDELEKAAAFFDNALITSGRRNPAWGVKEFTLIELPDKNTPGAWSKKYAGKIDTARMEAARYEKIKSGIVWAKQHALRNRYTLDIYDETASLVNYPVKLILALNQYDTVSNADGKKEALRQIEEVVNYFHTMRKSLENMYSKTRFMQNPDDYLLDMNHHHHLAAKTNNSDWLYLYEIPMVENVKKWLREQS